MTDGLAEKDISRVMGEVDFENVVDREDYDEVRDAIRNRFPDWGQKRTTAFTKAINSRFEGTHRRTWKQEIIDERTGIAGRSGKRYAMIRDAKGHFFGKPEYVQFYEKAGGELWGINTKTGKRSKMN